MRRLTLAAALLSIAMPGSLAFASTTHAPHIGTMAMRTPSMMPTQAHLNLLKTRLSQNPDLDNAAYALVYDAD